MITFVLPSAPGKNALYRNVSQAERARAKAVGKTLKGRRRTHAYNSWANSASWAMKLDGNKTRTWEPITGPVEVEIITGNPRLDSDASAPAIFDLFTDMRVWLDDSQVYSHRVSRGGKPGETVVIVREMEEKAA